jgi:hypothetical protein
MQLVLADDGFVVLAVGRHCYPRNYNNYEYNQ